MTTTTEFTAKHLRKGETFIGVFSDRQGNPYCAILLPGDNDPAPWEEQLDWAKSIGGDLLTRAELVTCFEQHRDQFQEAAYWSNQPDTDPDYDAYAWFQSFGSGTQNYYRKSFKLRARRVRRVPIQSFILAEG